MNGKDPMKKKIAQGSPKLERKRKEIDQIDQRLLNLLNERIRLVSEAIAIKKETGEKLRDLKREWEIIERLKSRNKGPLREAALREVFRMILKVGRRHSIP
jgi:chorismate mutase / prephenate dehydratase